MRGANAAVCALMALAGSFVEVHAREWRVRLDGEGHFMTIGAAIEAASEGDSILIGSGDYSAEEFLYFRESLWVSGVEEGAGRPILPRTWINVSSGFELSNIRILSSPTDAAATIWARNLVIRGSEFSGGVYSGLRCVTDSALISACEFMGNTTQPSYEARGGGLRIRSDNSNIPSHHAIAGCTFIENDAGERGGAIYACPSNAVGSMIEIRNCFFLGNEAPVAGAILVGSCWDGVPRITNNTFIRNRSLDAAVYLEGLDGHITNNIFAFNECFGYWVWQLGKCGCNLFWGNRSWGLHEQEWGGHCGWGEGVESNEIIDPGFCNRREGDYSLTATSPGLTANFTDLFREQGCEGIVGAFGMGCQVSPTREASWGELKRLFGGAEADSAGRPSTSGAGQK